MDDLRQEDFDAALQSSIGQATGMIMEPTRVNADAAFQVLAEILQHSATPLRVAAEEFIVSLPTSQHQTTETSRPHRRAHTQQY